ncbi:MAG: hypothetical protein E4G95_09930, partial [Bacteroidia bacterium]
MNADINSNHCKGIENLIPYYSPPAGGKINNKSLIGAELTSLYETYISYYPNFDGKSDNIFQFRVVGGIYQVFIEVVSLGTLGDLLSTLSGWGFETVLANAPTKYATGWMPVSRLMDMNSLTKTLNWARPLFPGVGNGYESLFGLTQSQGDRVLRSDFTRMGYGIDGAGVKIGVISNSYNTRQKAEEDVGYGDLPGAENGNGYYKEVDVLLDIDWRIYGSLSDEGRAMLQIVHDIAPGAELAFRTGFLGELDMADGIRELADDAKGNCDIIVDDITYITAPFFRDGVIARAVDEVVAEGVTFFSSAGNFGDWSYENMFIPGSTPGTISGKAHDFGGDDIFQLVNLDQGTYTIVLQWDDGSDPLQATTMTDMDLFLTSNNGSTVLGFNRVNTGGAPVEVIPFSVKAGGATTNIVISKASGNIPDVRFKYIVFRGGDKFEIADPDQRKGTSTIVGHANAAGAIAVGAVRFDNTGTIMSFSSHGGTAVNGDTRADKPAFTAPNGVNTTVDLGNGDWDGDDDIDMPNFFGTSAAAPHAAAVAALVIEAKRKFGGANLWEGNSPTPAEILAILKSSAIPMGVPSYVAGAGFIQANRAIGQFANPTPYISNLVL